MKTKFLIYAVLLTSGIVLGVFFCNFSYFVFEKTIKFTDLISIIVTSFLGIYIATGVNKAFTKNNSEKEFLISEVKATLIIVNKILQEVNSQKLSFNNTVKSFKSINENIILIEKLLKTSHCKDLDIGHIRTTLYSLRKLTTSISPTNAFIILDNHNYKIIQTVAIKLKTKLYDLIFEINKV